MPRILVIVILFLLPNLVTKVYADFDSGNITTDTAFDKQTKTLDHTLNISNGAALSFTNDSIFNINSNITINNKDAGAKAISINKSTVNMSDGVTINSVVNLQDSSLNASNGYITELNISGDTSILVKGTKIDTLNFTNSFGKSDAQATGFESINVKNFNIDFTGMDNDKTRIVNLKSATIDTLNIKGTIDISKTADPSAQHPKLTTNFKFVNSTITNVNYEDSALAAGTYVDKDLGEVNFSNTKITNLKVSLDLMRNITFNGGEITNFTVTDTASSATQPTPPTPPVTSPTVPTAPDAPTFSNLQLLGTGKFIIDNFNLSNTKRINFEGDATDNSDNGSMSSLYIKKMTNYDATTKFSLYDLKDVIFGTRPQALDDATTGGTDAGDCTGTDSSGNNNCQPVVDPDDDNDYNPDNPNVNDKYLPTKDTAGGTGNTIDISYLLKVTNLQLYDQTVKFDIPVDTVTHNVSVYQLNSLKLYNSLIDNSDTAASDYDLDVESSGFTVFYFYNSGVKTGDTLRLKVSDNSQFTANDMTSNLKMDLGGEKNVFILKSNSNNKSYTFNTNYNFCYLKVADGATNPTNCAYIRYNYWNMQDTNRLEQNIYYLNVDTTIAPLDGSATNNKGESVKGNIWFNYKQPIGDQCAKDQGTDGTGRGGFPCEFGNKIEVDSGTTTFLKALDNLTVLEIAGDGRVNFADINASEVSDTWITKLRIRGGTLYLGTNDLHVDNLDIYNFQSKNYGVLQLSLTKDANPQSGKIIVNQDANFHNNKLKIDLYFNQDFTSLNQKVTLDVLELGKFVGPDPNGTPDPVTGNKPNIEQQATVENLQGVDFAQGIMFDTDYYWKDNKLYVDITRVHDFSYWIKNADKSTAEMFDSIVNNPNYQINVDPNTHVQSIGDVEQLNDATVKIINQLFKAQNANELKDDFISLRPINNQFLFHIADIGTNNIINLLNTKNYLNKDANQKLEIWTNAGFGNDIINDNQTTIGANLKTVSYAIGADMQLSKTKLGVLFGYGDTNFNSTFYDGESTLTAGGIYTETNLTHKYYLNLNAMVSQINYKGTRTQDFLAEQARYKINGQDAKLIATFGNEYKLLDAVIKPYVTGSLGYIKTGDYNENSTASAALHINGFSNFYYNAGIGVNYLKQVDLGEGRLVIPSLGLAYTFKYYNLANTTGSFMNVNGVDSSKKNIDYEAFDNIDNSLQFNAGINYIFSKNSSVNGNFQAELLSNTVSGYSLSLGYKYRF